jgi:Flp pilus assembly protein TadG
MKHGLAGWLRGAIRRRRAERSRAAAVVEFAIVLPLLITIVLGVIEYGWVFMVRLTMENAAREGCRLAVLQTTGEPYSEVLERIADVMDPTGVSTYEVSMTHATVEDPVEVVRLTLDYDDISLTNGFFGSTNFQVSGTCSMRKEGMGSSLDAE